MDTVFLDTYLATCIYQDHQNVYPLELGSITSRKHSLGNQKELGDLYV
jgi:hypothetical protein